MSKKRIPLLQRFVMIRVVLIITILFSVFSVSNASGKSGKIQVQFLNQKGQTLRSAQSSPDKVRIVFDIPEYALEQVTKNEESYIQIVINGLTSQPEIGKPAVPVKRITLEIPEDTVPKVRVVKVNESKSDGVNLLPQQMLPTDGDFTKQPFQKDLTTYASDAPFPANNILDTKVAHLRNHKVLTIDIAPFRVNPKRKTLLVASHIELEVSFKATDADSSSVAPSSPAFDQTLQTGIYGFTVNRNRKDTEEQLEKYMILYDDQFVGNKALDQFIDWKKRKGYDVVLVRTSEITAEVPGSPTSQEIVTYLQELAAADYPTYLLVIGDENQATGVQGTPFRTRHGGYTDLYFACRDNNDWLPDLLYGRLPAADNDECTSMLTKVMDMDRNPPPSKMYDRLVVAGQIQDYYFHSNIENNVFCETSDYIACYFEQNASEVNYQCTRAICNPDGMTAEGQWNQNSIVWNGAEGNDALIGTRIFNTFVSDAEAITRINDEVNDGLAILQHRDHGVVTGWGSPSYSTTDVEGLHNGALRPLVISVSCLTGAYHSANNFTKAWLTHADGGAYGVISATDASYSWANDWMNYGLYLAFLPDFRTWHNNSKAPNWPVDLPSAAGEGSATRLGQMLNFAKMYLYSNYTIKVDATFKLFHVFGDPESFIRVHAPATQNVSFPNTIETGYNLITVNAPIGSRVCLYSEALGIQSVSTATDGTATFSVNPSAKGSIAVTVTGYDLRPYEGIIEVGTSNTEDKI